MRPARRKAFASVLALAICAVGPAASAEHRTSGLRHSSCAAGEVRAAVGSFAAAFNRGDYERLDALFAAEPAFRWFSSAAPGRRLGRQAKRRSTLIPYFEARRARGHRIGLVSFGFNGNASRWANFEVVMRGSAPAFRDGDRYRVTGKGSAVCDGDSVRFIVMSYGRPELAPAGSPS